MDINKSEVSDHGHEIQDDRGIASKVPQYEIDALARVLLPAILEFYRSEAGQREFAEWKAMRENKKERK